MFEQGGAAVVQNQELQLTGRNGLNAKVPTGHGQDKREGRGKSIAIVRVWVSWVFNGLTIHTGSAPYLPSVKGMEHGTVPSFQLRGLCSLSCAHRLPSRAMEFSCTEKHQQVETYRSHTDFLALAVLL